jgi:hypothetical protein
MRLLLAWRRAPALRRFAALAVGAIVSCTPAAPGNPASPPRQSDVPAPVLAPAPAPASVAEPRAPAAPRFDRIRWTEDEAACHAYAKGDCVASLDIAADGTVVLDPWGEPGAAVLRGTLTPADLEALSAAFTSAGLLGVLGRAPVCDGADASETMLVIIDGAEHRADTGMCNVDPLLEARRVLFSTVGPHFSDHHLICPPI